MIESKKKKSISPNNPNQTENQGGRPPIWIDKWTDDVVIDELTDMLLELKENEDYIYIGELFNNKPYSRSSFIQQVSKRKENENINKVYNTIKELLETRAVKGLLGNKLNSTGTIFHLKNNYKWVDKKEIDQTNKQVNYTKEEWESMSIEELSKISNGE